MKAEISQLGIAAGGHQNVRRFDVAVRDAGCVRRCHTVRHASQQLDHLSPRVFPARPIPEHAGVYELGNQVLTPLELASIVHNQDVRMIE